MAWVYILKDQADRYYIGSTANLVQRFQQHCTGCCTTTRKYTKPLILLLSLELETIKEARALEIQFKKKKNSQIVIYLMSKLKAEQSR